jgi:hypothetical protein
LPNEEEEKEKVNREETEKKTVTDEIIDTNTDKKRKEIK